MIRAQTALRIRGLEKSIKAGLVEEVASKLGWIWIWREVARTVRAKVWLWQGAQPPPETVGRGLRVASPSPGGGVGAWGEPVPEALTPDS